MVLSPIDEEVANSSKKTYPIQDQSAQTKPYFIPKMVEIDTLFQTKTAKKTIPFGAAHTYIASCLYERLPPRGEKRVTDYESRQEPIKWSLHLH